MKENRPKKDYVCMIQHTKSFSMQTNLQRQQTDDWLGARSRKDQGGG